MYLVKIHSVYNYRNRTEFGKQVRVLGAESRLCARSWSGPQVPVPKVWPGPSSCQAPLGAPSGPVSTTFLLADPRHPVPHGCPHQGSRDWQRAQKFDAQGSPGGGQRPQGPRRAPWGQAPRSRSWLGASCDPHGPRHPAQKLLLEALLLLQAKVRTWAALSELQVVGPLWG